MYVDVLYMLYNDWYICSSLSGIWWWSRLHVWTSFHGSETTLCLYICKCSFFFPRGFYKLFYFFKDVVGRLQNCVLSLGMIYRSYGMSSWRRKTCWWLNAKCFMLKTYAFLIQSVYLRFDPFHFISQFHNHFVLTSLQQYPQKEENKMTCK